MSSASAHVLPCLEPAGVAWGWSPETLQPLGVLMVSSVEKLGGKSSDQIEKEESKFSCTRGWEEGQRAVSKHTEVLPDTFPFYFRSRHCEEGVRSLVLLGSVLFPASGWQT